MESTDGPRAPRTLHAPREALGRRLADQPGHVPPAGGTGDNRLLAALPWAVRRRLDPDLERVPIVAQELLCGPERPIEDVYFPISGIVSLCTVMAEGTPVEVATVGNEGLVGVPVFLGAPASRVRAVCQVAGDAWRMPAGVFGEAARRDGPLRELLQYYVLAYIDHLSQSAACDRAHSIEQRCARSLLMTRDRTGGDRFPLTQEALAGTLGVRRGTVSQTMSGFRQAGLVTYTRGVVTALDRARLEAAACACYRIVQDGYDRALGGAASRPHD